jgi:ADP-ribose pyrophosphatase YjhB (NUDIX family)
MADMSLRWLEWAREIHALAQTSQHYARGTFERERAERLLEIAAEIVSEHSVLEFNEVKQAFRAQPGYVTPKVDVRGALIQDGKILMVREALDGGWTLPGGWADVGETPSIAVVREVLEETGLSCRVRRLVGVYDANRVEGALDLYHAYKLVFLCEVISGELMSSVETSEVGFFALDELPSPFSPHRTTPKHIQDAVKAFHQQDIPTVFD